LHGFCLQRLAYCTVFNLYRRYRRVNIIRRPVDKLSRMDSPGVIIDLRCKAKSTAAASKTLETGFTVTRLLREETTVEPSPSAVQRLLALRHFQLCLQRMIVAKRLTMNTSSTTTGESSTDGFSNAEGILEIAAT